MMALESASAIMTQSAVSKADQVVDRAYLKTVGILAESRLTQYVGSKPGERKMDKWVGPICCSIWREASYEGELIVQFNLIIPDIDLHRQELKLYQTISGYSSQLGASPGIPPLLIAIVLDTSDIPSGQALIWNRLKGKVTLDTSLAGKRKGREQELKSGIVLERWTYKAEYV
jgi:autophagy-related protein 13